MAENEKKNVHVTFFRRFFLQVVAWRVCLCAELDVRVTQGKLENDGVQLLRPSWITTERCSSTVCEPCDEGDGCLVAKSANGG